MKTTHLLLALSLCATFVTFVAPLASACAPIENCIPGCQYRCPPGCGDNIPCCDDGIVDCLIGHPCTTVDCISRLCVGPVCLNLCTALLGCPIDLTCNNLYCIIWQPPPLA